MTYLINFLLVPLYYLVLRLALPRRHANRAFWWIVTAHAVLFRALANPFNYVDTGNYAEAFRIISHWHLKEAIIETNRYSDWGRGYVLYNWLVSRISNDPKVFFVVTSILSVGGILLYYKKMAYTALAPVMLYLSYPMLYLMGFGVIRQHLAMPLLLFALYYIEEKPKVSLFLMLGAILLHTSSIVFVPFYFVYRLMRRLSYGEMAIMLLAVFIAARFFITMMLTYLPRYAAYTSAKANNNTLPVLVIGLMLLLLYEARLFDKVKRGKDRNLLMFLLYGFALSVFCVGQPFGGRLSLPAIYVMPAVLSLLYHYGGKRKDEYKLGIVYLFSLVVLSLCLSNGDTAYQHYNFIWERIASQK